MLADDGKMFLAMGVGEAQVPVGNPLVELAPGTRTPTLGVPGHLSTSSLGAHTTCLDGEPWGWWPTTELALGHCGAYWYTIHNQDTQ